LRIQLSKNLKKPFVLSPTLLKQLNALPESERAAALLALVQVDEGFGRPHVHAGLGIRKLRDGVFEFRVSRAMRGVFREFPDRVEFELIGSHEDVQKFMRVLR